jgi:hypothetical protein
VANVSYIGRNGGQNAELEREKTEALRLSNEVMRAKLAKMRGDVVDRRMVTFGIESSWALLRERIMQSPTLVAAELRDLGLDRHSVKLRIDDAIRRFLCEVSENLQRITSSEDFFAKFFDESVAETAEQKAARERKRDAANAKRRQKRAAKKT